MQREELENNGEIELKWLIGTAICNSVALCWYINDLFQYFKKSRFKFTCWMKWIYAFLMRDDIDIISSLRIEKYCSLKVKKTKIKNTFDIQFEC